MSWCFAYSLTDLTCEALLGAQDNAVIGSLNNKPPKKDIGQVSRLTIVVYGNK